MPEILEFTEEQTIELRKLGSDQLAAIEQVNGRAAGLAQIASDGTAKDMDLAGTYFAEATIKLSKSTSALWKFLRKAHPKTKEGDWKFNVNSWSIELVPPPPAAEVSQETPAAAPPAA